MNTFTVSSTELKNNISEVLNRVSYEKKTAVIERHGEEIARLVPGFNKRSLTEYRELVDKYFGIWKGEEKSKDAGKPSRHFRKRPLLTP